MNLRSLESLVWIHFGYFKRVLEAKATESSPKKVTRASKGDYEVILYFKSLIVRVSAEAIFYICFGDSSGKVSRAFPSPELCKMTPLNEMLSSAKLAHNFSRNDSPSASYEAPGFFFLCANLRIRLPKNKNHWIHPKFQRTFWFMAMNST